MPEETNTERVEYLLIPQWNAPMLNTWPSFEREDLARLAMQRDPERLANRDIWRRTKLNGVTLSLERITGQGSGK